MRSTSSTSSGNASGLLTVFFVLNITFCLVSAGIFKANTNIGMRVAYAKKSKDSSEETAAATEEEARVVAATMAVAVMAIVRQVEIITTQQQQKQNPLPPIGEPTPTSIPSTPPPPPTCEQGSATPECSGSTELPTFL
jgi:hypothetical protein